MEVIKIATMSEDITWLKLLNGYINQQTDMFVYWSASTSQNGLNLAEIYPVKVILIDINFNESAVDGILLTKKIRTKSNAKIITLIEEITEEFIIQSFRSGAANCIPKADFEAITSYIRKILWGFSPLEVVLKDYQKLLIEEKLQSLTSTEKKIILDLKDGYSKEMICDKMCIALTTYKKHISNIIVKFQAKSIKEIISHIDEVVIS